jgi:hypothetical protein
MAMHWSESQNIWVNLKVNYSYNINVQNVIKLHNYPVKKQDITVLNWILEYYLQNCDRLTHDEQQKFYDELKTVHLCGNWIITATDSKINSLLIIISV